MSLSNKYNIPQETIKKMINDGVISCSWPMYEEIYAMYETEIQTGKSKTLIYYEISEKKGVSERTVRDVVSKMKNGKI